MKIGSRGGHTQVSPGASGILDEVKENRQIISIVNNLLASTGNNIVNCQPPENFSYPTELNYGINTANNNNVDFYFSVHFNSSNGNGNGSEVCVYNTGSSLACSKGNAILENLEKLGFANRGIKPRGNSLGELSGTNMQAIIIEICFVGNKNDADILKSAGYEKIARAIANGIDSKVEFDITTPVVIPPVVSDFNFKIDSYAHVQDIGDVRNVSDNNVVIGTTGKSLRLEAIGININGVDFNYTIHMQNVGDVTGTVQGQILGSSGMNLRLEGITINVKAIIPKYKLQYRVHIQDVGWTNWVNSGEFAGTRGRSLRMEAVEIRVVKV